MYCWRMWRVQLPINLPGHVLIRVPEHSDPQRGSTSCGKFYRIWERCECKLCTRFTTTTKKDCASWYPVHWPALTWLRNFSALLNPICFCSWPKVRKMQGLAKNQDCVVEPVHFLIDCISPQQFVTDTLLSAGIDLKQGKGGREYTFTPVSAERNDNLEDNDEVSTIKA